GRRRWRRASGEDPDRVDALAAVIKKVEFEGHALPDTGAEAVIRITSISQASTQPAKCLRAGVLQHEGEAVRLSVRQLETKVGGEVLNVYRCVEISAARFVSSAVCELKIPAVDAGAVVQNHCGRIEAGREVGRRAEIPVQDFLDRRIGPGSCGESDIRCWAAYVRRNVHREIGGECLGR